MCAAVATVLLAAPAAAQSYGGLVIKGGLSYGNVSNSGVFPGDAKQRSGAALGLGLMSGGVLGFGVEGLWAQRGFDNTVPGGTRHLDYIDVPAYLRFALQNPAIEPFAYAGPQVSFEIKCDADDGVCPEGRKKTSYAGVIGAGLRLPQLAGISVEGRYVYGLTDLRLNTVTDSESYKTRSFMVLFGIGF
jgi:hypothetical protein